VRTALKYLLLRGASQGVDLNFAGGVFWLGGASTSAFTTLPGASFSRTDTNGTATALDLAGNAIQFATGVPRITNRGLLVEEGRTNLLLRSQEFDNAAWVQTTTTVTANAIAAPDGSLTADLLTTNATSGCVTRQDVAGIAPGNPHTMSFFAKAGSGNTFVAAILFTPTGVNGARAWFNTTNGAVSGVAAAGAGTGISTTSTALANGWYLFTLTVTPNGAGTVLRAELDQSTTSGSYNTVNGGNLYLWQADVQPGSFPTSPIITTGAAGTRGGDVPLLTGVPFYAGGVTLLADLEELTAAAPASANEFIASLSDNSINNRISLFRIQGTSSLGSRSTVGGAATNPGDIASVLGVGVRRAGASVLAGRSISAVGGTLSTSAAPASVPPYTQLNVGLNDTANGSWVNAYIRRIRIIPRAVSDAELQALTAP
jgi:hypothetical protein